MSQPCSRVAAADAAVVVVCEVGGVDFRVVGAVSREEEAAAFPGAVMAAVAAFRAAVTVAEVTHVGG